MRRAVVISLVVHCLALGLIFRHTVEKQKGYPPFIIGHLSAPPLLGVQNPPAPKASETSIQPAKAVSPPKAPERKGIKTTEISDKKPPKRPPKPQPPAKDEEQPKQTEQNLKNKGLPEGVELGSEFGFASLDQSGFDQPTYLDILFAKIRNEWENPYEGTDKITATIYFAVGRDGKIIDSAIEKSSGIPAYDQAALRAVLSIKAPPLPNQFGSDELGIHLGFQYIPNQ